MFEKNLISIEIGYSDIKIVEGSKNAIKTFGTIKTPEGCYIDDCPTDIPKLSKTILDFLKYERIKPKEVAFVIQGQDIVIRHMETPIMDRKGIMKTVQWEVSQYLPGGGADYLSDYQIIETIVNREKKAYQLMIVSVPKKKIDKYIEVTEALRLKLSAIDIAPNNICRVFSRLNKLYGSLEAVGIVNMGTNNSIFSILEKDKLVISREIPFGLSAAACERYQSNMASQEEISNLIKDYSLENIGEGTNAAHEKTPFVTVMSTFEKLIQFYASGKTKKSLDRIYIIGEGSEIRGISSYAQAYLNTPVEVPRTIRDIGINLKSPVGFNFRGYVNTMGLLLRKE
jgi:type IV pilus assembly protein PilM